MSALSRFKILELSEAVAGEYCGKLLADFGADIIKIEKPGVGSPTRRLGPFAPNGAEGENSGLFAYLNTNKHSLALDISAPEGAATLRKLLAAVDVVIDDHAPGWLKNIGLNPATFEKTYPHLVLCSITPYGQEPSDDRIHAEDLNVFQASGWGFHTPSAAEADKPPLKGAGRFMASYEAGLDGALCVAAALYERQASKLGRFIDISKQAVLASRVDYVLGQMIAGDMDVSTNRGAFDLYGPAGIFATSDGYVYIWMSAPAQLESLAPHDGRSGLDAGFPENWLEKECTPQRVATCREHLSVWLKTQKKQEVEEQGQRLGLTLAQVNTPKDLLASPQYKHRGYFAELDHPEIGQASYPTTPYKLSATPSSLRTAAASGPP